MKPILSLTISLFMLTGLWSCNAQPNGKDNKLSVSSKVEVYYFHFTSRCVTCKTVEAETQKDLEALYAGKVNLQSVNLEEPSGKELAKKLNVSGQTLLIVKGDTRINITNEGFMYARNNPEKFKSIIKDKVDPLLN